MGTPIKDFLGIAGDLSSIIGLIATLGVAIAVRRLRSLYIFKGRVPDITARISGKASDISTLAADFPNTRDQIAINVRQIGVYVESLARKSPRESRSVAKRLVKRIKRSSLSTRADVTEIYTDIQTLLAQYEELQRDMEWER